MEKCKINYIFSEEKDINDILTSVLNKELKKYIQMICKNKKSEVLLPCVSCSRENAKNC